MMATFNATVTTSVYDFPPYHSPSTNSSSSGGSTSSSGTKMNMIAFRSLIITIAVIGAVANGFVALIIGRSKQLAKDKCNVLFLNQMALDMYSCVMLTIVTSVKIANLRLAGSWGYWLCIIILDEVLLWIGLNGSTANLVVIAVERYIKIVHPIWHKNHFRPWMIYAAVAFTWIDGIALNVPLLVITSGVAGGQCMSYAFWNNDQAPYIYGIWYFVFFFVTPLLIFVYCYGRILAVVRRQAMAVNAGPGAASGKATNLGNTSSQRAQMSVIKTMLTVTVVFVVCWLPNTIYYLLTVVTTLWNLQIYYVTIFIAFLNICLNPFVYAGQHDLVRTRLRRFLLTGKNLAGDTNGSIGGTDQRSATGLARGVNTGRAPANVNQESVSLTFALIRDAFRPEAEIFPIQFMSRM
jgi:hypothetical protein